MNPARDTLPPPVVALETLRSNLEGLGVHDRKFAESLLGAYLRFGTLSQKQWPWVITLAQRATTPKAHEAAAQVGNMTAVIAMFDAAARAVQHSKAKHPRAPKIVLALPGLGTGIRLSIAGQRAKVPGSVTVLEDAFVQDDSGDSKRPWIGRVLRDGTFEVSRALARTPLAEASVDILTRFALDPLKVAAEHGKLTGKCCFCNTTLTDPRSTEVGYGPICAEKFGLAWGGK